MAIVVVVAVDDVVDFGIVDVVDVVVFVAVVADVDVWCPSSTCPSKSTTFSTAIKFKAANLHPGQKKLIF